MRPFTARIRHRLGKVRVRALAILIGTLVVVLACDGFVAHVLRSNYFEMIRFAEDENANFAHVLEQYLLKNMQGVDLLVTSTQRALEADPALRSPGNPRLMEMMRQWTASYPGVSSLAVVDRDGNVVAASVGNGGRDQPVNVADRPYFQAQKENPRYGLFIDVPHRGRLSGKIVIVVSRAVQGPGGAFDGVVLAAISLDSLREFLAVVNVGRNGLVSLYREDGPLLARVPATDNAALAEANPERLLFAVHLPKAPSGNFEGIGLTDGRIRQISYRKVAGLPLVVTVARDKESVLARWKGQAWTYGTVAALLNVLILGLGTIVARETSRRESYEDSLVEHEQLIRLVANNVPMLIAYVDKNETYRFVNRLAERWMKHTEAEFLGHQVSEMLPPELYVRAKPRIEAALAGQTQRFEEKRLYGDGVERWADVTYVPVMENGDEVGGYIVLSADITDRKLAEERLRAHEEQLRQAQKMEVVGQLTGGVAHDFNNLLGIVLGNLELLDTHLPDKPEERRILQRAIDAVERGGSLTRQLLAFSRKQMLQPQSLDIGRLLPEIAGLLRRTLGPSIEVTTVAEDGLWNCRIDRSQLETALLNLALNARDAMPKGGRLRIEASNFALDEAYATQYKDVVPGEYVALSIIDTGTGMPADVVERAFEPFFTTKDVGKGSGLGLSMVYGFVKQSGGHIRLYSEPGIGTTVRMYLPRAVEGEAKPAPPVEAMALGQGQLVLVVEDNLPLRQVAVVTIQKLGYETVEAGTVDEALAVLERNPTVALLFTDVVLPGGKNGFELAAEARRRNPRLKVLYASGHPNVGESQGGRLVEGAVIVPKPFRVTDLARHINKTLRG